MGQSLLDLMQGFGVALQPHNLMWSFVGVLIGNLIGVLHIAVERLYIGCEL